MMKALRQMLFGDDLFISYSHRDATVYAAHLTRELTALGFSCFFDRLESVGTDLPSRTFRALRLCKMLVVIGSTAALDSHLVAAEIEGFKKEHGEARIALIEFDRPIHGAEWGHLVEGLVICKESGDALLKGTPSKATLNGIRDSFSFMSQRNRLRQAALLISTVIAGLVLFNLYLLVSRRSGGTEGAEALNVLPWVLTAVGSMGWMAFGFLWLRFRNRNLEATKVAVETELAGAAAFLKPFISYSHEDKSFAKLLEVALGSRGVRCWLDEKASRQEMTSTRCWLRQLRTMTSFCCAAQSIR
jgi:hypothetical protein